MSVRDLAVSVREVSKSYSIRHEEKNEYLSTTLLQRLKHPFKRSTMETFWALHDVTFDVGKGEVLGIIGRNGAGKSTLLKILSRITTPTSGQIDLYGRSGSLLEVGTGFHPELTGRENIYLNGSILGMKRAEIDKCFDQIVDFAEIAQFLDTPVKRYSSGMYVRLAFAVAAHLNPEILIIDEVLAVGDSQFQKKCLGTMREVAAQGRTVLFVSHNVTVVRSLCTSCCVLQKGRVALLGGVEDGISIYMKEEGERNVLAVLEPKRPSGASPWIVRASVLCDGDDTGELWLGGDLCIQVKFGTDVPLQHFLLGYVIRNEQGDPIINANNLYQNSETYRRPVTQGVISLELGIVPFMPGNYVIDLYLGTYLENTHIITGALRFDVVERDIWGSGQVPPSKASQLWWPTKFNFLEVDELSSVIR